MAVGTGLAAQEYGVRFFENDARPGGWIEYPGNFKDDEQRRKWRAQWQEQQSGRNRHKAAVLEFGMKYHELTVSNDDAQFIETKKMSRSEIATLFRIPPHMIGDLEKATFSNIEQQSIDFVVHCLTPWLVRWEEAIRFNFMDPDDDSLQVEFPVLSLLRGDSQARGQYYHNGILDGWMTRNEARVSESLEPLPGLDEPLRPLNMVEESAAEDQEDDAELEEPPIPGDVDTNDDAGPQQADARLVALASAASERVARKEAETIARAMKAEDWPTAVAEAYAKHAQFVASALNVALANAQAYCDERRNEAQNGRVIEIDVFAEIARCKLERLAIKGTI